MTAMMFRLISHHGLKLRSTWASALVAGLASPTFFLLAMGVGLGSQISDADQASLGSGTYVAFIGPGLLATAAMTIGATEGMWPTRGLVQWQGIYKAVLITPVSARELAVGHVCWIGLRCLFSAVLYLVVLVVFGIPASTWALLMPLVAFVVGVVHAAPLVGITASIENDAIYAVVQRAFIFPMFMFSGAFFPVSDLPDAVAFVARLLPIWHGVELARSLSVGSMATHDLLHIGYLLLWATVGTMFARREFQKHVTP